MKNSLSAGGLNNISCRGEGVTGEKRRGRKVRSDVHLEK